MLGIRNAMTSVLVRRGYRREASYHFQQAFDRSGGKAIFFLHIGKNAGTQIRRLNTQVEERTGTPFVRIRHGDKYSSLPQGARYFFSVRDPVARFKSGFYSRKRKGAPRLHVEWSSHEEAAFMHFEHANDLAEHLFEDSVTGRLAWAAAQSITHTSMQQSDWFGKAGFFLDLHPPVWIIRQEHFNADFDMFLERAGVPLRLKDLTIARDEKAAHTTDYTGIPELSARAVAKLERWYARDLAFYELCEHWIEHNRTS